MEDELLKHAVLNQIETDFDDKDFDAIDELLEQVIKNEEMKGKLIAYLSDSARENWIEGKTHVRY